MDIGESAIFSSLVLKIFLSRFDVIVVKRKTLKVSLLLTVIKKYDWQQRFIFNTYFLKIYISYLFDSNLKLIKIKKTFRISAYTRLHKIVKTNFIKNSFQLQLQN